MCSEWPEGPNSGTQNTRRKKWVLLAVLGLELWALPLVGKLGSHCQPFLLCSFPNKSSSPPLHPQASLGHIFLCYASCSSWDDRCTTMAIFFC
jgi:hypothetical protein